MKWAIRKAAICFAELISFHAAIVAALEIDRFLTGDIHFISFMAGGIVGLLLPAYCMVWWRMKIATAIRPGSN